MSAKDKDKPSLPGKIVLPGGKVLVPVVLRVLDEDLDGRPRGLIAMYDNDIANLQGGAPAAFWIAYVNEDMTKPTRELPG